MSVASLDFSWLEKANELGKVGHGWGLREGIQCTLLSLCHRFPWAGFVGSEPRHTETSDRPLMGWRWKANKSLDAENPAQASLNSTGIFVKASFSGDGWSLAGQGDSGLLSGGDGRLWDIGRASGTGRWYHVTALLEPSWRLFLAFLKPVAALSLIFWEKRFLFIFFSSHVDEELSVSVYNCAGFVRITSSFLESPWTCTLIVGRWCLQLCGYPV